MGKRRYSLVILIFTIALLVFIIFMIANKKEDKISQVCIKDKCFNVKIADNNEERAKGLMFIKNLSENEGMLFIFENEWIHSFWMKNTLIPLDIIWIDSNFKIIDIQETNPCKTENCESFIPKKEAKYVLELNQGISKSFNFSEGNIVNFIRS